MKTHRNIHEIASIGSHTSGKTDSIKSLLTLSLVILTVPVIVGCSKNTHPQDGDFTEVSHRSSVKLAVHILQKNSIRTLDALVFNDDLLQRLDSYQSMDGPVKESTLIGSCGGDKIVLLCANTGWSRDMWRQYNSFPKASALKVSLEEEERDFPVMTAHARMSAGEDAAISMERLSSEVWLRSVCCDFTGKPYAGESITEAKVYLTNVSGTCPLVPQPGEPAERIINHGGLIRQDLKSFKDSSLIIKHIDNISKDIAYPDARLTCYPNTALEESLGTPFTRLVIEGRIRGETWYWPIDINRSCGASPEGSGSGTGVERNRRYIFDVTIHSKGTKDPDQPVSAVIAETILKTETWKEKEEYAVGF